MGSRKTSWDGPANTKNIHSFNLIIIISIKTTIDWPSGGLATCVISTPSLYSLNILKSIEISFLTHRGLSPVWPDLAIYCTLGNFLKPLATINLPKSSAFLGHFCKGVKIFHFSIEIIFGQLLEIWQFFSGHTVYHSPLNPLVLIDFSLIQFPVRYWFLLQLFVYLRKEISLARIWTDLYQNTDVKSLQEVWWSHLMICLIKSVACIALWHCPSVSFTSWLIRMLVGYQWYLINLYFMLVVAVITTV